MTLRRGATSIQTMAKIIIEIEDREGGGVSVGCTPKAADLLAKHYKTVAGLSPAESYAVFVLNRLRDASKAQEVAAHPWPSPA